MKKWQKSETEVKEGQTEGETKVQGQHSSQEGSMRERKDICYESGVGKGRQRDRRTGGKYREA